MFSKIESGIRSLDNEISGGYPIKKLTLIYGEEKSGKTSLALQAAINNSLKNRKTIWIDCGMHLHPERISVALGSKNIEKNLIIFLRPKTFEEQTKIIEEIPFLMNDRIKLIIFENYNELHRIILGDIKKDLSIFKDLSFQIAYLKNIAFKWKIPLIVTAQVHEVPIEEETIEEPVAARISKYWANIIIKLQNLVGRNVKKMIIEKGGKSENKEIFFRITEYGVEEYMRDIVK
ncbi:MAG: ATPase domain-containing protein [Nitrososphaerota archaeon]